MMRRFIILLGLLVLGCRPSVEERTLQSELLESIRERVVQRAQYPGLDDPSATTQWWHHVAEYMTDAVIVHKFCPSPKTDEWLRDNLLDIIRRSESDWSGPAFRPHGPGPMMGYLETAHICWAVSACLEYAGDLFTDEEIAEIKDALREKGLIPCRRYLDNRDWFSNWNCVMLSGYATAAAALDDREALSSVKTLYSHILDHFEADGSFGESLQYGNYAAYATMITYETLHHKGIELPLGPYVHFVEWAACALMSGNKALDGWPVRVPLPRSVNFGDCGAVFRPSGDLLMHIAVRAKELYPDQAALAAWLFEKTYLPLSKEAVHDQASFGFINDFGLISVLLASQLPEPKSPSEVGLPEVKAFSGGDCFLRDCWDGHTILAYRMPAEPRHSIGHLHEDINSLVLSYDGERLLADPGHSCYRNSIRDLDKATSSHNTCSFVLSDGRVLRQKVDNNRRFKIDGDLRHAEPPVPCEGERLIIEREGNVSIVGSDAAALYGAPLREFRRHAVLCGSNVVFVVDHIVADEPLQTNWHWQLDNTDNLLEDRRLSDGSLSVSRPCAGMKLKHFGVSGRLTGPVYSCIHDAYHPLPAQFCEGRPGSGHAYKFSCEPSRETTSVTVIVVDERDAIDGWTLLEQEGVHSAVNTGKGLSWSISVDDAAAHVRSISDGTSTDHKFDFVPFGIFRHH